MLAYDPYDVRELADPYPTLRDLRRVGPVHWVDALACWAVVHHREVKTALSDPERFSSVGGNGAVARPSRSLVGLDGADHVRVRRPVARYFCQERLAAIAATVSRTATAAVERASARDRADAVTSIAEPVAVAALASLLGMQPRKLEHLRSGHSFQTSSLPARWRAFFDEHVKDRRRVGGDDLVSELTAGTGDGALTDDEIVDVCLLLLVAGWDTPRDLVAASVFELSRVGDAARPATCHATRASAIEELLRYVSPVQAVFREATETMPFGGREVPDGSRVLLSLASANRDERVWIGGDELVPARFEHETAPEHLAFGAGPHGCVGARLARVQLGAVLQSLDEQRVALRPLGEPIWGRTPWFRRLRHGPISVAARAS